MSQLQASGVHNRFPLCKSRADEQFPFLITHSCAPGTQEKPSEVLTMWLLAQSRSAQLAACCSGISTVLIWLLYEQGGFFACASLVWGRLEPQCGCRQRQVPVSPG